LRLRGGGWRRRRRSGFGRALWRSGGCGFGGGLLLSGALGFRRGGGGAGGFGALGGSLGFGAGAFRPLGGGAFLGGARRFLDHPLAGAALVLGELALGTSLGRGSARRARGGPRRRRLRARLDGRATFGDARDRRVHAPTLGLHHHGLGAAMAEALLHHTGTHSPAGAGLEGQWRP
jgi:hypothetical protein